MSSETQLLDSGVAPTGFTNDAPFKKKGKKKDPGAAALKAIAYTGIAMCVASLLLGLAK